jgi:hypothetical protein
VYQIIIICTQHLVTRSLRGASISCMTTLRVQSFTNFIGRFSIAALGNILHNIIIMEVEFVQ